MISDSNGIKSNKFARYPDELQIAKLTCCHHLINLILIEIEIFDFFKFLACQFIIWKIF